MYRKVKILKLIEKVLPILKIKYLGKDSQSLQGNPAGLHSCSPSTSIQLGLTFISGNDKVTIPITTIRPNDLNENDIALFSLNLASIIKFRSDGTLELNNASESAIKYESLELRLQDMIIQMNTELAKCYNVGTTPETIVEDFSSAKVDKIKVG